MKIEKNRKFTLENQLFANKIPVKSCLKKYFTIIKYILN